MGKNGERERGKEGWEEGWVGSRREKHRGGSAGRDCVYSKCSRPSFQGSHSAPTSAPAARVAGRPSDFVSSRRQVASHPRYPADGQQMPSLDRCGAPAGQKLLGFLGVVLVEAGLSHPEWVGLSLMAPLLRTRLCSSRVEKGAREPGENLW